MRGAQQLSSHHERGLSERPNPAYIGGMGQSAGSSPGDPGATLSAFRVTAWHLLTRPLRRSIVGGIAESP
jgi:hypothetical protein